MQLQARSTISDPTPERRVGDGCVEECDKVQLHASNGPEHRSVCTETIPFDSAFILCARTISRCASEAQGEFIPPASQ
jgi:hypothetical protein